MNLFQLNASNVRTALAALSATCALLAPQLSYSQAQGQGQGQPVPPGASTTLAAAGFGGRLQVQAVCYLFNAGPTPVTLAQKIIIPEGPFGESLPTRPFIYDSCGTLVASGAMCAFVAQAESIGGNACKVTFDKATNDVRGSLELRDVNQNILNSLPLSK